LWRSNFSAIQGAADRRIRRSEHSERFLRRAPARAQGLMRRRSAGKLQATVDGFGFN